MSKPLNSKSNQEIETIEYYALRGIGWDKEYPSGMFRIIRGKETLTFERVDRQGNWVKDSSLIRHIAGYSDDAEPITQEEADKVLEYFRKKDRKK